MIVTSNILQCDKYFMNYKDKSSEVLCNAFSFAALDFVFKELSVAIKGAKFLD